MLYKEIQPPVVFTKHVECYWEMSFHSGELNEFTELIIPSCTFNIIFTDQPLFIKTQGNTPKVRIKSGATFIGQTDSCISFSSKKPTQIFGIRFKPFAFANIIKSPIYLLNDRFLAVEKVFDLEGSSTRLINDIVTCYDFERRAALTDDLLFSLFENSLLIDQTLRGQLNYILDRKGVIKVQTLFSEFGISKVTLRKHFINKEHC